MSAAAPAGAQAPSSATKVYATRADLENRLAYLDQVLASTAYSDGLKRRATEEVQGIRERLRRGDFQVGDRILLEVEGEAALTDSFTVAEGPRLRLPVIGDLEMSGILRAELETHLSERLARFLRQPRLRARPLMRIGVDGAVARPGFVTVPAELVLADVLVAAGGASPTARTDRIRVERNNVAILEGAEVENALREGRTLDQLGIQAGDRLVVPQRGAGLGGIEGPVRALSIILTIPLSVIALTQIF
ncbi:MAG TPA: polysaccharide biosynthesis/export family protein [Gemmatimonadales bacterium]|nr:polysaccharide biosynthesis/export family protein [Gemmatimonadales bacterium]